MAIAGLMMPGAPASAEGSWSEPTREAWWDTSSAPGRLQLRGSPGEEVSVRHAVALGNLAHQWTITELTLDEAGALDLGLVLPPEAWLDDLAEDYVTDLVTVVDIGPERHRLPGRYVAWPDGPNEPPVLLSRREMRATYPNGVLDAELRVQASGPHVRVLPWTGGTPEVEDTGEAP